jgi:hypothetical protein
MEEGEGTRDGKSTQKSSIKPSWKKINTKVGAENRK